MGPYLKSRGVFQFLQKEGVEVNYLDVPDLDWGLPIIHLTAFETESKVEEFANQAELILMDSHLSTPDVYWTVTSVFAELACNAVQHSNSEVGAFGYIHFDKQKERFMCAVADGGIGIRRSLEQNPSNRSLVSNEWTAIEVAMRERVSGTGEPTRGMGLFSIADEVRRANRKLEIQSGGGGGGGDSCRLTMGSRMGRCARTSFPGYGPM